MVNYPLIRPYFLGGLALRGVPLDSHKNGAGNFKKNKKPEIHVKDLLGFLAAICLCRDVVEHTYMTFFNPFRKEILPWLRGRALAGCKLAV